METYLGVDVGTTNIKACLFSPEGGMVSSAKRLTPVHQDESFGECHIAEDLWDVTASVIRACITQASASHGDDVRVRAVAIASMAEEVVCLDEHGRPVSPIIPWYDRRTREQVPMVEQRISAAEIRRRTGLPLDSSFTLLKFLWLREHHADVFHRTRHWLPVSDYINYRLTGTFAVNPSLASRTMLYNPFSNRWDEDIAREFGLSNLCFSDIVPGGTPIGVVTREAAEATGLSTDTIVGVGGHDDACAAVGAGVVQPNTGLLSSGTAEAIFVAASQVRALNSASICIGRHVTGQSLYLTDFLPTGALIRWALKNVYQKPYISREELRAILEGCLSKCEREPIVHFEYTREPITLSSFSYRNLTLDAGSDDMMAAILWTMARDLQQLVVDIESATDDPVLQWVACGGLTDIPRYMAWKEQMFGKPIRIHRYAELTAGGAAVLSAVAAGTFTDYLEAGTKLLNEPRGTVA
jgi:xylulokinase